MDLKHIFVLLTIVFCIHQTTSESLTCEKTEGFDEFDGICVIINQSYAGPSDGAVDILASDSSYPKENFTQLFMSACDIPHFPNALCSELPNVSYITIENTQLSEINIDSFLGCNNLITLSISNTEIVTLGPDIFSVVPKITNLRLFHNKLQSIHPDAFRGLDSLSILGLHEENDLQSLPAHLLDPLSGLRGIFIKNNAIQELKPGFFANNPVLSFIILDSNQLLTGICGNIFRDAAAVQFISLFGSPCLVDPSKNSFSINGYSSREDFLTDIAVNTLICCAPPSSSMEPESTISSETTIQQASSINIHDCSGHEGSSSQAPETTISQGSSVDMEVSTEEMITDDTTTS